MKLKKLDQRSPFATVRLFISSIIPWNVNVIIEENLTGLKLSHQLTKRKCCKKLIEYENNEGPIKTFVEGYGLTLGLVYERMSNKPRARMELLDALYDEYKEFFKVTHNGNGVFNKKSIENILRSIECEMSAYPGVWSVKRVVNNEG